MHGSLRGDLVDDQQLSAALAHAARTLHQARTPEDTLQMIADTALLSIPSVEHVGVSVLDRRGQPHTMAAWRGSAWRRERLRWSRCSRSSGGTPSA
jgi:hypothetical protein